MSELVIPKELPDWLERVPDMLGWDLMLAWPMEMLQHLVEQDHLRRLASGDSLRGLRADITDEDTQITYVLANYRVSSPSVTLLRGSYQSATVKLTLAMDEGTRLDYTLGGELASIRSNTAVNMLYPELEIDILYKDGKLFLDTANANTYKLELGSGFLGRQGAALISAMLKTIEPSKATLDLARITPSATSEWREVGEVVPRSQAVDGQQALLLFMSHKYGARGFDPDDNGAKALPPMLVPDASEAFLSTVVLSRRLQQRTAYGQGIAGVFEGGAFSYEQAADKPLAAMVANAGVLRIPSGRTHLDGLEFENAVCEVSIQPGAQALRVEFHDNQVVQTWGPIVSLDYRYRAGRNTQWVKASIQLTPRLDFVYKLDPGKAETGLLDVSSVQWSGVASNLPDDVAAQHAALAAYTIRRGFINALFKHLDARLSAPLLASLRLDGLETLQPDLSASTQGNLAMVGTYRVGDSTARINEQDVRLAAGDQQRFTLSLPGADVDWRCESLPDHPWAPGEINDGLYTAPSMAGFEGATQRVRIIATDRLTGRSYTTLVTVVATQVAVWPELFVRHRTNTAQFEYQSFKMDTNNVEWILENVEGGLAGKMTANGANATYTPVEPGAGAYCSIDRLVAKVPAVDAQASGLMLSLLEDQTLFIYVEQENSSDKQLQLRGKPPGWDEPFDDIKWWLPLGGPGEIDKKGGLYQIDPEAPEKFVLIRATAQFGEMTLNGHIVLLLPYDAFADVNQAQLELQQRKWLECSKRLAGKGE